MIEFPKETINDETCELLQPYLQQKDFNYKAARQVSGNIAGLCVWVRAMVKYHNIAKFTEPKFIRVQEMTAALKRATREVEEAELEVQSQQRQLAGPITTFSCAACILHVISLLCFTLGLYVLIISKYIELFIYCVDRDKCPV